MADEDKVIPLGLLWSEAMARAMLPHVTFLAGHRVCSIVEVLSVHSTLGAVEVPVAFVFLVLLEILLKLFALRLQLSLRLTLRILCVSVCRRVSFASSFQTSEFLFGKNSFGFTFFQTLLACHTARLMAL
jgi:hypothetical protein